jgi:hypothetical protein
MTVLAGKRRRRATDAEVQRLNVYISPDAHRRLMVHAVYEGLSPGLFVERLIEDHCKSWKVQANAATRPGKGGKSRPSDPGDPTHRHDEGPGVNLDGPIPG